MSMAIRNKMKPNKKYTRQELLALNPQYNSDDFFEKEEDGSRGLVKTEFVGEARTEQSFKDQQDVNKIIKKHQIRVAGSHLQRFPEEFYGDFEGFDLLEAHDKINKINEAFGALPSDVRAEFNQDPYAFAGFVTDPANRGKLAELLPKIAEPEKYFPNPAQRGGQGAAAATQPSEPPVAASPPPVSANVAPGASDAAGNGPPASDASSST